MEQNQLGVDKYRNERLSNEIKDISERMEIAADKGLVALSERIFVNVFLPLFAGDKELMYPVTFNTWSSCAGGPCREVNVVDVSGKILFTVPPLFDRSTVNPTVESNVSIAHVVLTAGQYTKIHPVQGVNYLNNELSKRAMLMQTPGNVITNLEIWNNIFIRYGRPPIITVDIPSNKKDDDNKGDTLDYEFEPM